MCIRLTKLDSIAIKFHYIYQFAAIIAKIFTKDTQWERKWPSKQKSNNS